MAFIQFASQPEQQAIMANEIAYAPTNPDAIPLITEIVPWFSSTSPGTAEKGILVNVEILAGEPADGQRNLEQWFMS